MRASQAVRAFYDAWPRADQRSHLLHGLKHGRGTQEVEEEYLLTYYLLEEAEADSTTSSMSRSRTSMRSTSMSRSSAPVDVSAEALLVGPVTILAHAELLGQAERGRNQREAPRSTGRCAVGDSDGPRCNI